MPRDQLPACISKRRAWNNVLARYLASLHVATHRNHSQAQRTLVIGAVEFSEHLKAIDTARGAKTCIAQDSDL